MIKSGHFPGVEFIPVDQASHVAVRETFRKLYNACLPKEARSHLFSGVFKERKRGGSGGGGADLLVVTDAEHENLATAAATENGAAKQGDGNKAAGRGASVSGDIMSAIAESGWLGQIQSLLQLAGVVVELMCVQGASVAVCLGEGFDAVTQVGFPFIISIPFASHFKINCLTWVRYK